MTNGVSALLKAERELKADGVKEGGTYNCSVLKYDAARECIFLQLQSSDLTEVSLDVVYSCEIGDGKEKVVCTGRVRERYRGVYGKTIRFQVKNGFYKINIKSLTNK